MKHFNEKLNKNTLREGYVIKLHEMVRKCSSHYHSRWSLEGKAVNSALDCVTQKL